MLGLARFSTCALRAIAVLAIALAVALLGISVPAVAADDAHITGTVTGAGGSPLSGIEVSAYLRVLVTTTTDAQGHYDLGGLEAGTQTVDVEDSSLTYAPQSFDVVVGTDETVSGKDVQLAVAGHVKGTVTGPTNAGLPQIAVTAYRVVDGNQTDAYAGTTSSSGTYDIGGLAPGTYRLEFEDYAGRYAPEYFNNVNTFAAATDIPVAEGAVVTGKNAQLGPAAHITGTVTGATTDDGVEATVYSLVGGQWEFVRSAVTSSTGAYDVNGLQAGTYRLGFSDDQGRYLPEFFNDKASVETAADITVAAGATAANRDATLASTSHITGRVTAPGGVAVPNVAVIAYQQLSGDWVAVSGGVSTGTGDYDVAGLSAGTYRIGFRDSSGRYASEFYDDATAVGSARDISVGTAATASGKDAVLVLAAHIQGHITAPGGANLGDVTVTAYQLSAGAWDAVGFAYTAAAGTYDLGGLAAGTYRIGFADDSGEHLAEFYVNAASVETAVDISLDAGATAIGKDAELATVGAATVPPTPAPTATPPAGSTTACTAATSGVSAASSTLAKAQAKVKSTAAKVKKLKKAKTLAPRVKVAKVKAAKKKAAKAKSALAKAKSALSTAQAAVSSTCR